MTFHPCYLSTWLKKEPGKLLVEMEREQLKRLLRPVVGDYLVQIGGLPELAAASPIRFKWFFNTQAKSGSIQVALDELPLAPESVDVIVLVHVLEFTPKPPVLLREAFQALAPGGQIIIVNLNPWSLWGLKHGLTQDHEIPWSGHFWPVSRMKHWLRDLGLRIVMSDTFCFRPPLHSLRWWRRLLWLEALGPFCFPALGGFYILAAQKRAVSLTPFLQSAWPKKINLNKSLQPTIREVQQFSLSTARIASCFYAALGKANARNLGGGAKLSPPQTPHRVGCFLRKLFFIRRFIHLNQSVKIHRELLREAK